MGEFFDALGTRWPLTAAQQSRLAALAGAALGAGWTPAALAAFTGANRGGVRNPYADLATRLSPGELPDPPRIEADRRSRLGAANATSGPAGGRTPTAPMLAAARYVTRSQCWPEIELADDLC